MQVYSQKAADLVFSVFSISYAFSESVGKYNPLPLPPITIIMESSEKDM